MRWRTCAPDFCGHKLEPQESFVGYSSLVVPHERIEHGFGRHRLERPESSVGGRRNVVPHERRLTSRGAGGGTRCRVPPPDPFFPEDRAISGARFAGFGIGLFYWGRNPLIIFWKPVGFRPIHAWAFRLFFCSFRCFAPIPFCGASAYRPYWLGRNPPGLKNHSRDSGPGNSNSFQSP